MRHHLSCKTRDLTELPSNETDRTIGKLVSFNEKKYLSGRAVSFSGYTYSKLTKVKYLKIFIVYCLSSTHRVT